MTHSMTHPRIATAFLLAIIILFFRSPEVGLAQGTTGYVTTGYGYSISRINLLNRTVTSFTSTGSPTLYGALNQRGTKLWVTSGDYLTVYHTTTAGVLFQSLSGYTTSRPVFSPDGARAYYLRSTYPTSVIVRDTATYARVDSFSITGSSSWSSNPVLSPDGNKLYFSDYSYLYEIDAYNGSTPRKLSVNSAARLELSPDGTTMYALTYGSIVVIDLPSMAITSTLNLQSGLNAMELSRDGSKLYVVNSYYSSVYVIDTATKSVAQHSLFYPGTDIGLDPSDSLMYIAHNNYSSSNLSIYNMHTDTTIALGAVAYYPQSIILPLPRDIISPSTITDLQAEARSYDRARLVFTAPGDDNTSGHATFYAVRYDTVPVTDANFATAQRFLRPPTPKSAGELDTIDLTGLRGGMTYYIGIKAGDEVLNLSGLATASVTLPMPPHIDLQPRSFTYTMGDNDSIIVSFTIGNTGASDLEYTLSSGSLTRVRPAATGSVAAPVARSIEPIGTADKSAPPCALQRTTQPTQSNLDATAFAPDPATLISPTVTVGASSGPRVLLLHSDYPDLANDVTTKLRATGMFSKLDTFDLRLGTPTLAHLREYDAVFVWLDYFLSSDVELGNVLADYVDQGGGLVLGMFSIAVNPNTYVPQIRGRFNDENYWVIRPGSISQYHDNLTLGTVQVPSHPIMRGVTSFIGNHSYRVISPTLAPGGTTIASWSDGSALITEREVKGTKRVDLNFFPPSSDVGSGELWQSSSDGAKIMANALDYVASGGKLKVTFSSDSGAVPAGGSQVVQAKIVTENTQAGNYTLNLQVSSNDPDSSLLVLPVALTVKDLTPPHMALRFFQNEELTQYLSILGVARELLFTPTLQVRVGLDSSIAALTLIDSTNYVYRSEYKLTGTGTLSVTFTGYDSVGNRTITSRDVSALKVSPLASSAIASANGEASLRILPSTFDRELFVTCQGVDQEAFALRNVAPVGEPYLFGPRSTRLGRPAELLLHYPAAAAEGRQEHFAIYRLGDDNAWVRIPTRVDAAHLALHGTVDILGEYRIGYDPGVTSETFVPAVPVSYELGQNYPNPFNPSTTIQYALVEPGVIDLRITNVLGQEVRTLAAGYHEAGYHEATWDGTTNAGTVAASGLYFYQLKAGGTVLSRKMLLMK